MQSDQIPVVVIDTTEVYKSLRLSSAAWQQTLALSARGVVSVCIPEVVIQEAIRHCKREVEKAVRSIRTGSGPLRQMGINIEPSYEKKIEEDAEKLAAGYEEWLRTKLDMVGVAVLPVPKISHEILLVWDLDGRKPFNQSGKGYRDALIWASVIEAYASYKDKNSLIFVTNNTDDFCGTDKTTVDPALAGELPANIVTVRYPDLKSMLDGQNWPVDIGKTPELSADSPLRGKLLEAVIVASDALVGNEINDGYDVHDYPHGLDFDGVPIPQGMETVTIESIEPETASLHFEVYDKLEDGTLLAKVYTDALVTLDGFMHHSDYFAHEEDVETHDTLWNEHYAHVYIERDVRLCFNTIIDPDLSSIGDLEFDSASSLSAER